MNEKRSDIKGYIAERRAEMNKDQAKLKLPWSVYEETEADETVMLAIQDAAGEYRICYMNDNGDIDDPLRETFDAIVAAVNERPKLIAALEVADELAAWSKLGPVTEVVAGALNDYEDVREAMNIRKGAGR